jgi:N-acetylmuramoyl-L-alanine amidase
VLWDLAQNQYLAESSALAEAVQAQLNALIGTRNRGVRQAPFRVLMGATMPAILVEVGFITNPAEETKFRRPEYLDQIVQALATAIGDYLSGAEHVAAPPPIGLREMGPP